MSTGANFPFSFGPPRPSDASDGTGGGATPPTGGQGGGNGNDGSGARRLGALVPAIIGVIILVGAFVVFSHVYADVLWFNQIGFSEVFWTEAITRAVLFVIGFLLMAGVMFLSLQMAWRTRPLDVPRERADDPLARFEGQVSSLRRLALVVVPVLIGAFAGATFSTGWQTVQLFLHRQPFGTLDPEFGLDAGFFVNTLPFLRMITGFVSSVILFSGIAGIIANYLFGGIRLTDHAGLKITKAAGWHLGISAALFLLVQGVNFWLDGYETVLKQSGRVPGALYTDVHAVIPTKTILAMAAVAVAVLCIVGAARGRWRLPLVATAMIVVVAVVAGFIYPALLQQFSVQPSEKSMQREYIQRNIDMTRKAYGLDAVDVSPYDAKTRPEKNALTRDAATTTNIRLLDPSIVSPAFAQLQQFRDYYQFPSTLSVDRYPVEGKTQDTVIAVRELNQRTDSWVNRHITYTHGYGVVAAYGNRVTSNGDPDFLLGGIPTRGDLVDPSKYEPRIYFGQDSPDFSVVGGPEGWSPRELDRPAGSEGGDDVRNTFSGNGGPNVGSFLNRLVYSIKFGSMDLLLSQDVNPDSQILYERDPQERVRKAAPYLTVDSTAYPAIVDGRVKWIVDAYTTSNSYPYSTSQQLGDAVRDSLTGANGATADQFSDQVNYLRNSVKATVDAYDGSVDLYAWEPDEPLLKSWQSVFPNTVKPMSQMSAELMEHVRYPEDMFKVQRELLGQYHVTRADDFYEGNDAWQVPNDPTAQGSNPPKQPPYYLSLRMPGENSESFSLTSTFIPRQTGSNARNVMYGFLAANGDAGSKKGTKADSYGKLKLLELPTQTGVPGPGQAQQNFDANNNVSQALNLLRQGASTVKSGNLLTLPVGGGMLYVQPVYVQSTGSTSYPTLRKVLVSYGSQVGFADTLGEALDQVFQGESGARTGEGAGVSSADSDSGSGGATPGKKSSDEERLSQALQEANDAIKDGQKALEKQDFTAYDKAQKKLQKSLEDATNADDAIKQKESGKK